MRAARLVPIPIDHVTARFAAYPLSSVDSLAIGLTSLHPQLHDEFRGDGPTRQLWRAAERATLGSFPGFSIDEAVAIRDRIWFNGESRQPIPLHVFLRRLAHWFLADHGATAAPKLPSQSSGFQLSATTCNQPSAADICDGDWLNESPTAPQGALARRCWKWLALELPTELLLAGLGSANAGPAQLELLTPTLDRHLEDHGFAETHLHLGAGNAFPNLWVSALHAIGSSDLKPLGFFSPGAELDEGRQLADWLVRSATTRYVLAAYLAWGRYGLAPDRAQLAEFLLGEVRRRLENSQFPSAFAILWQVLSDLRAGRLSAIYPFRHVQALYRRLTGVTIGNFPLNPEQVLYADPIARLVWPRGLGRATPETQFVAEGLSYLENNTDRLFEQLFWQVVRVRGIFFRHIVQRPLTPGLPWFVRFYGRLGAARKPMSTLLEMRTAATVSGLGKGLRSLEFRTSPGSNNSDFLKTARQTVDFQRELKPCECEVGLVLHFTKDRGGGFREGQPNASGRDYHASPRAPKNTSGFRFANFFRGKLTELLAWRWLLQSHPEYLRVLRGVDVCTDELGVPNWVLAPLVSQTRQAASAASASIRWNSNEVVPTLRTTVHAGEDFVHLLTGLRLVDDAIESFQLRQGDRLGHGIALGIDPCEWAHRAGRLAIASEDRLLDLVWQWMWHERGGSAAVHRHPRLDFQIMQLSEYIFGRAVTPYDMAILLHDLTDPQLGWRLSQLGFPNGPRRVPPDPASREGRLSQFLTDGDTYERGRKIIWIDPAGEADCLAMLQADLRRKVGARGLTVEVNPTSNLLIGDLDDLTSHPLWRLRPPRPHADDPPPVSVCIGSDDPIVFNTDLRQEYQFLMDALQLGGLSEEESLQWLDRTRRAGLDTRFTLPI